VTGPPPLPARTGQSAGPPPIPAAATPPVPDVASTQFVGQRSSLFGLAFRTGLLTILTLGFYRFWMKTRLRRWYWSAIRPGGLPLEYTGDPFEKLLGFLIAVVILAFYIGIVNLLLMFISFALLANNFAAYLVSLLGVIPFWFYASYRSRRYILARTRWRGVRFALEKGAWGYAFRAIGHWLITLVTLGLLWPRMTFWLEKYRTDRTFFGSARLHQGGRWQMLYRPYLQVIIPSLAIMALIGGAVFLDETMVAIDAYYGFLWLIAPLAGWLGFGLIHFQVQAARRMADTKSAAGLGLVARPRTGRVLRIYSLGYSITSLLVLVPMVPIALIFGAAQLAIAQNTLDPNAATQVMGLPTAVAVVLGIALYFAVFLSWSVLRHCFVTLPLWRHYAETLTITGLDALGKISQREKDEFTEAEGFAEALDVGAAI
jgi:uncharacterized membrane protein YjgN (DUF898 family)